MAILIFESNFVLWVRVADRVGVSRPQGNMKNVSERVAL